jgi:nucleotide-binding universal stress UspA family protein
MFKRILVPIDGSASSDKALALALQVARDGGGTVRLLHDLDELMFLTGSGTEGVNMMQIARDQGNTVLGRAAEAAKAAGVTVETQLVEEPGRRLGEVVAEQATKWGADLIVVGTYGRRGISRMVLGSGAEQVVRLAPVPVLTVRGGDEG